MHANEQKKRHSNVRLHNLEMAKKQEEWWKKIGHVPDLSLSAEESRRRYDKLVEDYNKANQ